MLFQILGPFQQVIFTQAPFSHIQCIQCDQIWQYFSTLAKLKSIYGFVLYLAKFWTYFGKFSMQSTAKYGKKITKPPDHIFN